MKLEIIEDKNKILSKIQTKWQTKHYKLEWK